MSDEAKTFGEQADKGDTTSTQKEEMISKTEYEKITSELDSVRKGKEKSEMELQNAKLELLSPEYISYLENKNKQTTSTTKSPSLDLESMSRTELVSLLRNDLEAVLQEYSKKAIDPLKHSISDLIAREEVRLCEGKYEDFNDYRKDMISLVRNNEGLSIEDAYKIAKSNHKLEKDKAEKEAAVRASSEKPGGPASSTTVNRDFKNKVDAAEDAWKRVVGDKDYI